MTVLEIIIAVIHRLCNGQSVGLGRVHIGLTLLDIAGPRWLSGLGY